MLILIWSGVTLILIAAVISVWLIARYTERTITRDLNRGIWPLYRRLREQNDRDDA